MGHKVAVCEQTESKDMMDTRIKQINEEKKEVRKKEKEEKCAVKVHVKQIKPKTNQQYKINSEEICEIAEQEKAETADAKNAAQE